MKEIKSFLVCCFVVLFAGLPVHSQISYCPNLGFEQGNFTNWVGHTWLYSTEVPSINTDKVEGIVYRRHSIMSDITEYDANTGYALKTIPPGYRYSARLGDVIIRSVDAKPRGWEQSLRYTMTIDSNNALLVIRFALVLQYASNHNQYNEPRFRFTLFGQNGDTIPDCSNYNVYASNEIVKGWQSYMPVNSRNPVQWRDWTTVGANLLNYIGQTITVEFMTADCTQEYHYGYAYFVAECHPLYITENYCAGDSIASLLAPEGFEKYSWSDNNDTLIDTTQIYNMINPIEGTTYSCQMTSATGCSVSLQSTVAKYIPRADFSSTMFDCNSNTVQLINLSATNHGTLFYHWDFGDGNTLTAENPQYTFKTSGRHQVSLSLINPPSSCVDTLTKEVESFSPPLVGMDGDSTYCPGLSIFLRAYGAYDYTWSNGSKADSIEVSAPGGAFWLMGRSSTGCVSDTIIKEVGEDPDWPLLIEGDTTFCVGDSTILLAYGAVSYVWNTGDSTNSICASTSGTYNITGVNKRGCEKSEAVNVTEVPLPGVNYTLSDYPLDSKHNQLICSSQDQPGVQYVWNMGDGLTETGSTVQHTYNISGNELAYTITLAATSRYGCTDSVSFIIDIKPFVPNVFTPNSDGINDVFMAGIEQEVFDRNGLLLYKGNAGWDGRYKGRTVDPDTYFYLIRYPDRYQQMHTRKGFVTLVR